MTPPDEGTEPPASFNVRTIGPEPPGATPIEEEDLEGLIPGFVATRADLNGVEYDSIARHLPVALRRARVGGPEAVLSYSFLIDLHRLIFADVWRWAGTLRRREANMGVEPAMIAQLAIQALDDARYWHNNSVYAANELAARVHARLVEIHPFPNGNGRATRLLADLYLVSTGQPAFTWGATSLDANGTTRNRYRADLVHALQTGDYSHLIAFARS